MKNKLFKILIIIFIVCISILLFLLYGPFSIFRDFWITTAMTTMNHQYLATWLYSDDTINEVLEKNKIIEPESNVDTDLIEINDINIDTKSYKDEYDKQVLEHEEGELYKYFEVTGYSFDAYMAVIYDPSKVSVVVSKDIGSSGEYLVDMSKRTNALVAINGGGFIDNESGTGNGGLAKGIVISNGKLVSGTTYSSGSIIGLTNDNKLYLGKMTAGEALDMGIRDAVEFGPYLIVNGEASTIYGNGGYGTHPRSAIGQRQDGIILFLVVDGRSTKSMGCDLKELIEIMQKYGAYNAANLDGGNSSVLVINHEIINHPYDWFGVNQTRPIATGFIYVE